uniref:Glycosyl transferase family 2 n=1 Tax=Candidatus Kentrum sp. FM TaxID=2126340 RepID=A0A450TH74_9GAMM|nr:MAG: Glycosyl transferase family 2 [Candidatus Kentron sp. FM]VFJ66532.1 MAG: Glycosyl transferase family 2 [Candidatus Kentron sp. FM]
MLRTSILSTLVSAQVQNSAVESILIDTKCDASQFTHLIGQQPLVSIIIPCWNAEAFIGEAIESALAQTYPNVEVIVIDDGSTDGSLDVIRSYGERIRWVTGENRGGGAARNRGIELARGELVQFLDADDALSPNKLTLQVPVALESTAELVYCDYRTVDSQGNPIAGLQAPVTVSDDSVCFILANYGLATSCLLHWRETLQQIGGFRPALRCSQERDLHLRLACAGARFRHLKETLFTVRDVPGSVSSNFIDILDQHSDIAWTAWHLLSSAGSLTEARRVALAGFLARDARAYLKRGFKEKARSYFAQAREMHPGGGLDLAYGPRTRRLVSVTGPVLLENLLTFVRAIGSMRGANP